MLPHEVPFHALKFPNPPQMKINAGKDFYTEFWHYSNGVGGYVESKSVRNVVKNEAEVQQITYHQIPAPEIEFLLDENQRIKNEVITTSYDHFNAVFRVFNSQILACVDYEQAAMMELSFTKSSYKKLNNPVHHAVNKRFESLYNPKNPLKKLSNAVKNHFGVDVNPQKQTLLKKIEVVKEKENVVGAIALYVNRVIKSIENQAEEGKFASEIKTAAGEFASTMEDAKTNLQTLRQMVEEQAYYQTPQAWGNLIKES